MADTSNGLMYGVAAVKFKPSSGEEKNLGWLDENQSGKRCIHDEPH